MRPLGLLLFLASCGTPRSYDCRTASAPPRIDGVLDEWRSVPWTGEFVDLASGAPAPLSTRAKMQWDDRCLYVAAEMEEPHVWATLTGRDSVVYHDDDFEIFLDSEGDARDYVELEVNALGTVFDLLLRRPYSQGGEHRTDFDFRGMEVAVRVDGSINDPSDLDRGWTVEIAIPWEALRGVADRPATGERWRVNFSRVDWPVRIDGGRYVIAADRSKPLWRQPHNWAWCPTGVVDIHRPARWGVVTFR